MCSALANYDYAAEMPIIDYHIATCHLPKLPMIHALRTWRMPGLEGIITNGGQCVPMVPEQDITGHEPDFKTFMAWAKIVPESAVIRSITGRTWNCVIILVFMKFSPEKTAPMIWKPVMPRSPNPNLARDHFDAHEGPRCRDDR